MKIKIDEAIKEFDGTVVQIDEMVSGVQTKIPFTFRKVITIACSAEIPSNPLTSEEKQQAFQIGVKLLGSKKRTEYDITTDQAGFLKKRVGTIYGPVVYGRFLELIGDLTIEKDEP